MSEERISITRIDAWEVVGEDGRPAVKVTKFSDGWESFYNEYQTIREPSNPDTNLDAIESWCNNHGWQYVRRWPGGLRAWKNELKPVRSKRSILALRSKLSREIWKNGGVHPRGWQLHAIDLAFDL